MQPQTVPHMCLILSPPVLHLWTVLCRAVDLVGFFMDCAMGCHSKWIFFTVLLHTNKYQLKLQYFWASMISRKIAATEKLVIKQSEKNLNSLELVHDLKGKHASFLGIKTELKFQLTKSFWQIDSNN